MVMVPVYNGVDTELDVLCKKILKKDAITRSKAISETIQLFEVSLTIDTYAAYSVINGMCI